MLPHDLPKWELVDSYLADGDGRDVATHQRCSRGQIRADRWGKLTGSLTLVLAILGAARRHSGSRRRSWEAAA